MKAESSLVSAIIGASGTVPLMLAQAESPAQNGIAVPVWAISITLTAVLGLVGYLLKRSWEQVDRTLEKLDARMGRVEERINTVERKLN